MRLVSSSQHTASSEYWRIFHPDHKNRGGYHEWAIPNGAPVDLPRNYPNNFKKGDISTFLPERLSESFLIAVKTNNTKKFESLLKHAELLGISNTQLQTILTQIYLIGGKKKKKETLLHLAAANGNKSIFLPLLNHFVKKPDFSTLINSQGNTAAHVAAGNNRSYILKRLIKKDIDFTIQNNKKQTAYDIAQTRNYPSCLEYFPCHVKSFVHQAYDAKEPHQETNKKPVRDPQFVYGHLQTLNIKALNAISIIPSSKNYKGLISYTTHDPLLIPKENSESYSSKSAISINVRTTYKDLVRNKKSDNLSKINTEQDRSVTSRKSYKELTNFKKNGADGSNRTIEPLLKPCKSYKELVVYPKKEMSSSIKTNTDKSTKDQDKNYSRFSLFPLVQNKTLIQVQKQMVKQPQLPMDQHKPQLPKAQQQAQQQRVQQQRAQQQAHIRVQQQRAQKVQQKIEKKEHKVAAHSTQSAASSGAGGARGGQQAAAARAAQQAAAARAAKPPSRR